MQYEKLVRDKIPDIIRANGEEPIYHILENDKMKKHLIIKLMEEYHEVIQAYLGYLSKTEDKDQNKLAVKEELADVFEVIMSLGNIDDMIEEEVLYLSQQENGNEPKDIRDCLAKLKKTVNHIFCVRQIHKSDYVKLVVYFCYLAASIGLQPSDIILAMREKRERRGGFTKRIYLQNVIAK